MRVTEKHLVDALRGSPLSSNRPEFRSTSCRPPWCFSAPPRSQKKQCHAALPPAPRRARARFTLHAALLQQQLLLLLLLLLRWGRGTAAALLLLFLT